jgi:hypothetical protein
VFLDFPPSELAELLQKGLSFQKNGDFEEAKCLFEQILRCDPNHLGALKSLAIVLSQLGDHHVALQHFEQILLLDNTDSDVHNNRGIALYELKRFDEALLSYERAIQLNPDHASAFWNKSLQLLLTGDLLEGWHFYEWGWRCNQRGNYRNYKNPLFPGIVCPNSSLFLIYSEQGLGDTIQFCRYAKLMAHKGASIVLEVDPALTSLISSLDPNIKVISSGHDIPNFDYQSPLLSLPWVFKTTLENIPAESSYLSVSAFHLKKWSDRLSQKTKPRIGLVWSGSTLHKGDKKRSIPLNEFEVIMNFPFEFHCLQRELREGDAEILNRFPEVIIHCDELNDFSDTGALVEHMDLVITVDTAVAHLAGALGKPVWILLTYLPDSRWLLDRDDSPWYSNAKLYRQDDSRAWITVITKVTSELKRLFPF